MKIWNGLVVAAAFAAISYAATPALIEAAQNKDQATVKSLLAQKADAKAVTADGTTALHWAAHWNDLDMVNALLAAGADPNAANRYGVFFQRTEARRRLAGIHDRRICALDRFYELPCQRRDPRHSLDQVQRYAFAGKQYVGIAF